MLRRRRVELVLHLGASRVGHAAMELQDAPLRVVRLFDGGRELLVEVALGVARLAEDDHPLVGPVRARLAVQAFTRQTRGGALMLSNPRDERAHLCVRRVAVLRAQGAHLFENGFRLLAAVLQLGRACLHFQVE